jgi:hypothetical protein
MRVEWLSLLAIAVLGALAWSVWPRERRARASAQTLSGRSRYTRQSLIPAELMPMLGYLHMVFPGQTVLTRVPLVQLLAPADPQAGAPAHEALKPHQVDYVVCDHQGMPQFAFDLERYHLSKVEERDSALKLKNRLLQSAGIRLVFLRQSVDRMPRPADLRRQLDLAHVRDAGLNRAASTHQAKVLQTLKKQLDAQDSLYASTRFRESEVVMGLNTLMDMGKADEPGHSATDPTPLSARRAQAATKP